MFFVFNNFPILAAEPLKPSFVAIAITTGLLFLKCDLAASTTGVSNIPFANFPAVFPSTWSNYKYIY